MKKKNPALIALQRRARGAHIFQEKLPNDLEVVHKADLVYTVSAREYWQKEILSKEETGDGWVFWLQVACSDAAQGCHRITES